MTPPLTVAVAVAPLPPPPVKTTVGAVAKPVPPFVTLIMPTVLAAGVLTYVKPLGRLSVTEVTMMAVDEVLGTVSAYATGPLCCALATFAVFVTVGGGT